MESCPFGAGEAAGAGIITGSADEAAAGIIIAYGIMAPYGTIGTIDPGRTPLAAAGIGNGTAAPVGGCMTGYTAAAAEAPGLIFIDWTCCCCDFMY